MSSIPKFPFSRSQINEICYKWQKKFLFCLLDPRWASVNRGVLICDECCSVHRSLGRHSSQVRHLRHTPWPPTQLQVHSVIYCMSMPVFLFFFKLYLLKFLMAQFFFIISPLDGSDVIQQWSQFNMGALPSGPSLSDEWKTEGQPSGQAAVSGRCSVVMEG